MRNIISWLWSVLWSPTPVIAYLCLAMAVICLSR